MTDSRIKLNKEKMLKALEKSLGIVTPACKEVGISRETFYRWCRDDEEFRAKVDDINDITLDFAENQLLLKIKEGSERSILFYMKYKGRKRGYAEKIDIEGNLDLKTITFEIVNKKEDLKDEDQGN